MSFTVKSKYIILVILLVLFGAITLGWYIGSKRSDLANANEINRLSTEIHTYQVMIGDQKTFIAQKEQEIKSQREAIKDGDIKREELRKLNLKQVNEITRLKLRVDTLLQDVHNSGGVITIHDTVYNTNQNAVLLPFVVTKYDEWLSLKDSTDIKGVTTVSLKMDVPIDLWAGIEKKTKNPIAILTSKNRYINVLSISSIKLDTPKDKHYGIGVQVSYGLTTQLKATPYVGIGLNYNVIRF